MLRTSPDYAGPLAEQRRRAITRRASTSNAVANTIAELAFGPTPEADPWQGIGGIAGTIVADLARRTGRKVP